MRTEELTIESLASSGAGVAHLADGRVAFVAGGLEGDVVRASYIDPGSPDTGSAADSDSAAGPDSAAGHDFAADTDSASGPDAGSASLTIANAPSTPASVPRSPTQTGTPGAPAPAPSRKRYVNATLDEVVSPSPHRVTPPCELARDGRCGGCAWACLSYPHQLEAKRRLVTDALERIAHLPEARVRHIVADCVPSERQWGYRNKVEFSAGTDVAGRLALGMHARSGGFVPLAECKLLAGGLESAPRALTGALRMALGPDDYAISRVGVRHSTVTSSTEIAVWSAPGRFPRAMCAKTLSQSLPASHVGVTRVLVRGDASERKVAGVESLAGRGSWTERLAGFDYTVSAPSFFQVNTPGAATLVSLVLDAVQPGDLDVVVDLYSGVGTFTLPLAASGAAVTAVEMEGSAVRDLSRNLERASLPADVIGGDVARELTHMAAVHKVVCDPPRSGLSVAARDALATLAPHVIAYVSCDPATLARDAAALIDAGYSLARATPVDFFPQTPHVETVAQFVRA